MHRTAQAPPGIPPCLDSCLPMKKSDLLELQQFLKVQKPRKTHRCTGASVGFTLRNPTFLSSFHRNSGYSDRIPYYPHPIRLITMLSSKMQICNFFVQAICIFADFNNIFLSVLSILTIKFLYFSTDNTFPASSLLKFLVKFYNDVLKASTL